MKVLESIRPTRKVHAHTFRAQCDGQVNGKPIAGYLEETGIPQNSSTETFAAFKLYIDN